MEGMTVTRKARKRQVCGRCERSIEAREPYLRHSLPPYSEHGNTGWWTELECQDCAYECGRPIPETTTVGGRYA